MSVTTGPRWGKENVTPMTNQPDPKEVAAKLQEENTLLKIEVNMLRWGKTESPLDKPVGK